MSLFTSQDDLNKREESRKHIRNINDNMVKLTEGLKHHVSDFQHHEEIDNTRYSSQEEMFKQICEKIENHTCDKSLEIEKHIEIIQLDRKEQNGHLKELELQGARLAKNQQTILNIAKGRASLWKDTAAVTAAIVGVSGIGLVIYKLFT